MIIELIDSFRCQSLFGGEEGRELGTKLVRDILALFSLKCFVNDFVSWFLFALITYSPEPLIQFSIKGFISSKFLCWAPLSASSEWRLL